MNEKEIKAKYEEYKRRGYIRPPELITDDDWDKFYNGCFNEISIAEMEEAIRRADFWIKKRDEAAARRKASDPSIYEINF